MFYRQVDWFLPHFRAVLKEHIILLCEIVCLHVEIASRRNQGGSWECEPILGEAALPCLWTLHLYFSYCIVSVLYLTEPILGQGGPSYLWTLRLLRITHTSPHTGTSHLSTSAKYFKLFHLQNAPDPCLPWKSTFSHFSDTSTYNILLTVLYAVVVAELQPRWHDYVDCPIWPFSCMFISRDFYVDCVIRPPLVLTNAVQLQALECEGPSTRGA